jgi:hypothetical protein
MKSAAPSNCARPPVSGRRKRHTVPRNRMRTSSIFARHEGESGCSSLSRRTSRSDFLHHSFIKVHADAAGNRKGGMQ